MTRTITALFDTREDADAGGERLRRAGVDAGSVAVHDQTTHRRSGDYSTREDKGLWATVKGVFVPDADRHAYEEGIRRGGFLLTADVDDSDTAAAVKALEEANSIDLEARSEQWRSDGWDYQGGPAGDLVDDAEDALPWGSRDTRQGGARFRSYVPDRSDR